MQRWTMRREHAVLAGIGLVLVGLLAGILGMLWVEQGAEATPTGPLVERVRLGSSTPPLTSVPSTDSAQGALPDLGQLNTRFRSVAEATSPAVVSVRVRVVPSDWLDAFQGDRNAEEYFRHHAPQQSMGSGVIISEQGYIVTNRHVVEGASAVRVTLQDKREFAAEVVGEDPSTDLAVLRIDGEDLPSLPVGDSERVGVGDWVLAIGNPFRLNSTVTAGIVSALGRQVNIIDNDFRIEDFIQTDAAINPGNSGGALVNVQGELVGINTAIATESGSYEGYGFAIPANLVERVVSDLITYGEVRRGFMGVVIQEVDARMAQRLRLNQIRGVYLERIRDGGAADRAGLRKGDVILGVNERPVNAPNELQSAVARFAPGEEIQLSVWRQGSELAMPLELMGRDEPAFKGWFSREQRPEPQEEVPSGVRDVEAWGVGLRDLRAEERATFGVEDGAYVVFVRRDEAAAAAGVRRGMVLSAVDGKDVASAEEAEQLLSARTDRLAVLLKVQRRNGTTAFYEAVPHR